MAAAVFIGRVGGLALALGLGLGAAWASPGVAGATPDATDTGSAVGKAAAERSSASPRS